RADPGVLVRIFDLFLFAVGKPLARAAREARRTGWHTGRRVKRDVAGRGSARVEVLVPPAIWRDEHAALVPRDDDFLSVLVWPHDREALARGNHDHDPRAVAMAL